MPGPLSATSTDTVRQPVPSLAGPARRRPASAIARDLDVPVAAQRLERVGQQVREELPQLVRVALRSAAASRAVDVHLDRTAPRACLLSAIVIASVIDVGERRRARPAAGSAARTRAPRRTMALAIFASLMMSARIGLRVGRVGQLPLEQAGHHLDAGERVLDLVRDRRRHLAERRQPVAQALALFELLDAGQVLEEERRADVVAARRRGPATACSRSPCRSCLQPQLGAVGQVRQLERAGEDARTRRGRRCSTSVKWRPMSSARGFRPSTR